VRIVLWTAVAALCLIAAVVARAPASLVDARVAAATDGKVRVTDAQGTLWTGAGVVRLADGSAGHPIAWRADPSSVVTGALAVALGAGPGAPLTSTLRIAPTRLELRQLDAVDIPMDALVRALAPGTPPPLGVLRVTIPQLTIDASSVSGQVRLAWQNAGFPAATAGTPLLLGTVTAELGDANGALTGPVRGSGGEVEVTGTLTWRPSGKAGVDLTFAPRAGLPRERQEAIGSTLARYGRPDGRGGFRIAISGPPG
jgi:general secretion pathway protein N